MSVAQRRLRIGASDEIYVHGYPSSRRPFQTPLCPSRTRRGRDPSEGGASQRLLGATRGATVTGPMGSGARLLARLRNPSFFHLGERKHGEYGHGTRADRGLRVSLGKGDGRMGARGVALLSKGRAKALRGHAEGAGRPSKGSVGADGPSGRRTAESVLRRDGFSRLARHIGAISRSGFGTSAAIGTKSAVPGLSNPDGAVPAPRCGDRIPASARPVGRTLGVKPGTVVRGL
jgi:hypothetical protein